MTRRTWWSLPVLAAALAALVPAPARADVADDSGEVEVYVGYLFPDTNGASADDVTYGIRGGYNFTPRAGFQGSLGRWSKWGLDATMFDLSFEYHVNPDARAVFLFHVGPGWTWASGGGASADSMTIHGGLGAKIAVGEKFYLRPDARYRWYEETGADDEWEVSLGFGWSLGK